MKREPGNVLDSRFSHLSKTNRKYSEPKIMTGIVVANIGNHLFQSW